MTGLSGAGAKYVFHLWSNSGDIAASSSALGRIFTPQSIPLDGSYENEKQKQEKRAYLWDIKPLPSFNHCCAYAVSQGQFKGNTVPQPEVSYVLLLPGFLGTMHQVYLHPELQQMARILHYDLQEVIQ